MNVSGLNLVQELMDSIEVAREGKGLEDGMVSEGSVGKARLLRGPIEEAISKGVVVKEEGVDDGGDERGVE